MARNGRPRFFLSTRGIRPCRTTYLMGDGARIGTAAGLSSCGIALLTYGQRSKYAWVKMALRFVDPCGQEMLFVGPAVLAVVSLFLVVLVRETNPRLNVGSYISVGYFGDRVPIYAVVACFVCASACQTL